MAVQGWSLELEAASRCVFWSDGLEDEDEDEEDADAADALEDPMAPKGGWLSARRRPSANTSSSRHARIDARSVLEDRKTHIDEKKLSAE